MFKFAGVAALLQLVVVGSAGAQSFDDFYRLCIATDAAPAAIESAAQSAGWNPLPSHFLKDNEQEWGTVLSGYFAPGEIPGFLLVVEAEAPLEFPGVRNEMCVLMTETVSVDRARKRLETLLSVGPIVEDDVDDRFWLFSKTESGFQDERALMDDGADVASAVGRGTLRYAAAGAYDSDSSTVMLAYGRLVSMESAQ